MFEPPPLHPSRPGVIAPVRVDPTGLTGPTRGQARGPGWRTSTRGRFVPSWVDGEQAHQRIVEAAAVLGPGDAVTGWAALSWLGARWFDGRAHDGAALRDVPLLTHGHVLTQPGFEVNQDHFRPGDVIEVDGLPVTIPVRSVAYEMRFASWLTTAVQALDMACYDDLVSVSEVAAYAETLGTWTGIPQMRKAVALGEENAWSPTEVSMRLVWTENAHCPRPLCNAPLFDLDGRHLGTPDLLDPVAGVVGEYDGSVHLLGSQRSRDVEKEARYRAAGLECVTMLAQDLARPGPFEQRLRAAYARASRLPVSGRRWTPEPPPWWTPTHTVARRRALDDVQRARLLRYRHAA